MCSPSLSFNLVNAYNKLEIIFQKITEKLKYYFCFIIKVMTNMVYKTKELKCRIFKYIL